MATQPKDRQLGFNTFPYEIKKIIFQFLINPIKFHSHCEFDEDHHFYDDDLNNYFDEYTQILMSVCVNWYKIISDIRSRKQMPLERYTTIISSSLSVFKWAIHKGYSPTDKFYIYACQNNRLDLLEFSLSLDFKINDTEYVFRKCVETGNLNIVKQIYNKKGFKNILSYNLSQKSYMDTAIEKGHIDIVKWLDDKNIPIKYITLIKSISLGHLHLLKWFIDNDFEIAKDEIAKNAIIGDQLHIMEWLCLSYKPDFSMTWDLWTCIIKYRRINFLKILPMYGYSMNNTVLLNYSIEHNRQYNDIGDVVEYLESGEF